jgi:tetratricopeptide (TPR) repeat protein
VNAKSNATHYSLRTVEQMLGLSRSVISGLVSAGYVEPARGARNEFRFSFQDVVLMRTAYHLAAANIPTRRLLRSLKQLRAKLPAQVPMSGLRIRAIGNDVAVREGDALWEAQTGQLLMDFEVAASSAGLVSILQRSPVEEPDRPTTAADWFARAERLEDADKEAAEAAYREVLALAPDHVYAYMNLGALLCDGGRCGEAVDLYERAARIVPDEPHLHFNAAIALEDQQRHCEALDAYDRCLKLAPGLADAHFNAARLCEKLGDPQGTLRHYNAFRRLHKDAERSS